MYFIHYIGSAMLIVLIAFIIVDVIHTKKLTINGLLGRVVFLLILFIALLRTD